MKWIMVEKAESQKFPVISSWRFKPVTVFLVRLLPNQRVGLLAFPPSLKEQHSRALKFIAVREKNALRLIFLQRLFIAVLILCQPINNAVAVSECVLSGPEGCTHFVNDSFYYSQSSANNACAEFAISHGYSVGYCGLVPAGVDKYPYVVAGNLMYYYPEILIPFTFGRFYFDVVCPSGQLLHPQKGCISKDVEKNEGPPQCPAGTNPINIFTGNKFQEEAFFLSSRNDQFQLSFSYNSVSGQWRQPYSSTITHSVETPVIAEVLRGGGNKYVYQFDGALWVSQPDVTSVLEELNDINGFSGWKLTHNSNIETYDTKGRLTSIISLDGTTVSLIYDDIAHSVIVTDQQSGDTLTLLYDQVITNRLIQMTDTDGGIYRFDYDSEGMLQYVFYPDNTSLAGANPFGEDNPYRTYHYEDPNFSTALTGITDETGNRFATWTYDSEGRATSSQHANGAELVSLDYTHIDNATDPRVKVTNELGKETTYRYTTLHGVSKVTQVEGHPTASCVGANKNYTYDANGFLDTVTDWEGHMTDYDHDARGLEIQRTEAVGTPQQRIITTQWHPDYRLPVKITEPDRVIAFTYDTNGQLLERKETPVAP